MRAFLDGLVAVRKRDGWMDLVICSCCRLNMVKLCSLIVDRWHRVGDDAISDKQDPTSKSCGGGSTAVSWAASATMHPRFYRSWLAEIGLRSLWSFSSHWFIKVHRRHQSRVPGCLSTIRLMSQSRQVTPNLWRTPNNSLPIWWWSVASSAVGRRCGCWVLGVAAQHGGVTAGDGNTVDSVAWCEHVTHYVHT